MVKPTNIKDIDLAYIMDYVSEQGDEAKKWLKDLSHREVKPDKNGRERRISFIEIRKEFAIKYFPELAPKPKEKKPSMYDLIDSL